MTVSVRNLFAYILMSAGVFLGAAGGLCTLGFSVGLVADAVKRHSTDGLAMVLLCLFVGAIPMSMGVGLFVAGRSLRRPSGS